MALMADGTLVAELNIDAGLTHSRRLIPVLQQVLQQGGMKKEEIDLVGVSMGPGSFTGLRIGLATAQAFAYARRIALHGVDTLMALACNCREEGILLSPLIDAQKGNYYQALYQWRGGKLCCLAPTKIVSKEELCSRIGACGCLLLGETAKLQDLPQNIHFASDEFRMPRASSVCYLANLDYEPKLDRKIFGLEPYYIRKSEAEELWEQRHH